MGRPLSRARRALIVAVAVAVAALSAAVVAIAHTNPPPPAKDPVPTTAPAPSESGRPQFKAQASHPQVVQPEAGIVTADAQPTPTSAGTSSRTVGDAEIRRELTQLKKLAAEDDAPVGPSARVLPDGRAVAPADAPAVVRDVIRAGNVIAKTPYLWGGGHGSWSAVGYDCSGSVSFALAGAGLLDSPLTSGALAQWGDPGPGRWITIYANAGHVFMFVAGLRFDTGALSGAGTRWQSESRSTASFTVRHPAGL